MPFCTSPSPSLARTIQLKLTWLGNARQLRLEILVPQQLD